MTTLTIISKDELKAKIDRKEDFQLVNVLAPEYDHLGSIKGSMRIPVESLGTRLGELDKSKEVIVYCASFQCNASRKAAEFLAERGFHVAAYEGGIKEWTEAGFPMERNKEAKRKGSCTC